MILTLEEGQAQGVEQISEKYEPDQAANSNPVPFCFGKDSTAVQNAGSKSFSINNLEHLVSEPRSPLGNRKNRQSRRPKMPKTRSSDQAGEEPQLDLALINERFVQSESSTQELRDRMNQYDNKLDEMMKMLRKALSDKQPEIGEGSNSAPRNPAREEGGRNKKGQESPHKGQEDDFYEDTRRGRNTRNPDNSSKYQRVNLPRMDFPAFDGNDPEDWLDNCEYYFDMFQIEED